MFAHRDRIHTGGDIDRVFKKSKKYHHTLFTVWLLAKQSGTFRGLAICSRKVDKRATKRNQLKRRVREILRKDVKSYIPHADVIVSLKPGSSGKKTKELKEALFYVLHLP